MASWRTRFLCTPPTGLRWRGDQGDASALNGGDVLVGADPFVRFRGLLIRTRSSRVGVTAPAAAIENQQAAVGQHAGGGRIPTHRNESENAAAIGGDIHHGDRVRIRADHVQPLLIGAERKPARSHAGGLAGRHGDVDGLDHPEILAFGNAHDVGAVRVPGRDEDPVYVRRLRRVFLLLLLGGLRLAVAQHHIRRMRPQSHLSEFLACVRVVVVKRAVSPTGNEK